MKVFKFMAILDRMAFMKRWSLMDCRQDENLKGHSFDVAAIAYLLVHIQNSQQTRQLDPHRAVTLALFHDATEVFTGDIPTPIKYFGGGLLKGTIDKLEGLAVEKMVKSAPEALQPALAAAFDIPPEYKKLIKAADQIAALRKAEAEIQSGNKEFVKAAERLEETLRTNGCEATGYFLECFPCQNPTLDQLIEGNGSWLLEADEKEVL